jgi:HAD superfamily hydrolase (TIGR01490 family)
MQKVAFFDIDGTVFRSSLFVQLVEALVRAGVFPAHAADGYAEAEDAWRNREGAYAMYIAAVVKVYYAHIKGVHYGLVADIGRAVVREQSHHVYRYTRDLIAELKRDNYYLVAISQSPKSILDVFCREYGFDKVYGRIYEIGPTDRFTGFVEEEHIIENKANIVKRVFQSEALTREGSIAVGDTEGDIPMLDLVDRPICFNPNQLLLNHAKRVAWEVVVERKDVVYEM